MISRSFEKVSSLVLNTDDRWMDKSYVASLRLKTMTLELLNLFLFNSLKIIPCFPFANPETLGRESPALISVWHGDIFAPLYYLRNRNIAVIASLSKDGDSTTKILDSLGYQSIRGSSSRGGAKVLLEAMKKLRKGNSVGFTVDGPRGPFHVVKPGIIKLAQKTKTPIFPLVSAHDKAIRLRSWDKLQIPMPFSKIVLYAGEPLFISPDTSLEEGCRILEARMADCEKIAMEKLKVGC